MRLLIADDHELLRDALKAYLETSENYVVEVADTVPDALEAIKQKGSFDLVLLDFQFPGMDGLLGLRRVIAANEGKPVALLSGVATAGTASAALRHGASAVLSKTMAIEKLKDTITAIVGGAYNAPFVQPSEYIGDEGAPHLTPRQEEVLRCICQGQSNKEIARQLKLQEPTVKMYVKMLYAKLDVHNRTQAALAARNFNLV